MRVAGRPGTWKTRRLPERAGVVGETRHVVASFARASTGQTRGHLPTLRAGQVPTPGQDPPEAPRLRNRGLLSGFARGTSAGVRLMTSTALGLAGGSA
jgi:hypothetical protein